MEHQMSIPIAVDTASYETFVIYRDAWDFTEDDLEFAAAIQPILAALRRQADALDRWTGPTEVGEGGGQLNPLSLRELAVLNLVSHGHTARAIGHRLSI
jgi:ATP/maltotriose-dependent transcriptional regulator MalT